MKKKILLSLLAFVFCLAIVGCEKESKDGWELTKDTARGSVEIVIDEDAKSAYDKAMQSYEEGSLTLIALLGEQVVAGTNYMYLCQGDNKLKVVIVYNDLEGNSSVTSVKDFDLNKYANKDISMNAEMLSGGWYTIIPGRPIMLAEQLQSYFDTATEKLVGVSYFPASVIATNTDSYAILCYGRTADANATEGVYVLTLRVKDNNPEIASIAAIDLKDFN